MNKKVLGIVLGAIALAGVIVGGLTMMLTSGISETADEFFSYIAEGEIEDAYGLTSDGFKDLATLRQFEGFVRQGKLAGNQGTFWHSRKVEGDEGDLEGTLELSGGTKLPLTVNLVKEKGDWRIHGIDINLGGMQQ